VTEGGERLRARVLTVSDRASRGEMADESGPAVRTLLLDAGFSVGEVAVVPDDRAEIQGFLRLAAADAHLVVTTGGTGVAPRDVTPQATAELLDYQVPGMAELMRAVGLTKTPMAAVSRSLAGVRGRCLILNLPGSVKGATESLEAVTSVLPHACSQLLGRTGH
jgi:molybdenum cofactor synthesis domain-containing protein